MTILSVNTVTAICAVFGLLYLAIRNIFGYWKRRGIPQLDPSFPFGDLGDLFKQKCSPLQLFLDIYNKSKHLPIVGIYATLRPMLYVNDPELIKDILVKDFPHFRDRGIHVDEKNDPLSGHLFSLAGDKWKNLRTKLTPTFTSGKLKGMFHTLLETGVVLQDYMEKHAKNGDTVEIRDIMARYNTDIISSVAFGIEIDSINQPDHVFRVIGRKFFAKTFLNSMRFIMNFLVPKLHKYIPLRGQDKDVEDFIVGMVKDTLEYRETNNVSRKDFFQLLIQLRNTGKVSIDERWDVESTSETKKLTLHEVAAQAFVFYIAGFETSSTTMSFCLYELSKNPETQRKAQDEIDQILQQHDGQLTYDSLMEMKYVEHCIDEALRIYPPASTLNRECTKTYTFEKLGLTIEKGTAVILPVIGLHRDAEFYPDPMQFRPERFEEDDAKDKPYYPFGDGPRNCIGLRMGKVLTKVGLSLMLSRFNFELGKDTPRTLTMDPRVFIPTPIGGINLKVTKRIK